jgi:hypothetical protein
VVAAFDILSRIFSNGPEPSKVMLAVDVSESLSLPEDYDDGPFAVPELRGEGAYEKIDADDDEEDTIELDQTYRAA